MGRAGGGGEKRRAVGEQTAEASGRHQSRGRRRRCGGCPRVRFRPSTRTLVTPHPLHSPLLFQPPPLSLPNSLAPFIRRANIAHRNLDSADPQPDLAPPPPYPALPPSPTRLWCSFPASEMEETTATAMTTCTMRAMTMVMARVMAMSTSPWTSSHSGSPCPCRRVLVHVLVHPQWSVEGHRGAEPQRRP